jgi:hypothetical protein
MKNKKEPTDVLDDELDEEVLSRLPEWFKILRDEHKKRKGLA